MELKVLSSNAFPVVGIGASAGGLDAFKKLLKGIPEDSGMAYVLVQHLDPNHESLLPDILQKVTQIPVLEISDDIKVEPNHIYVIPSNKMMVANDGVLQLTTRPEKNKNKTHLPIDLFFTSLAEVHQSHAIGVVLSGTASDGTVGLKAIKDHGGITFAQDEASAAFEGMPNSAVQAGVVDFILPPEKIPQKILEITNTINGKERGGENVPPQVEDVFKQIISLLRIRKGIDFTYYKPTTIRRRILRRMALSKNEDPASYVKYVRENKSEQDILYHDLLIPVTAFFRDQKTFDNLCNEVFPLIIKNKTIGESIRIWVAGCSTGEEAYSIAICFKDFLGDRQGSLQIFATDVSESNIRKARTGLYTKNEIAGVGSEHLKDYFAKVNGGYQINKSIRDMCVFAAHNFLKDPPFGKMHFISCRNVLIYMEPYLQKKALTTFHYALNQNGFLLLGKSESASGTPNLFASVGKNDKLFVRKDVPSKFRHMVGQRIEENLPGLNSNLKGETLRTDFQKIADDIILSRYTPAGVVVNEAMDIVLFRGHTGRYLEQAAGKPSHQLLKMARSGLAFDLRTILHKAKKEKATVTKENISLETNGSVSEISIEAIPLPNIVEPHYLVLFHETNSTGETQSGRTKSKNAKKGVAAKSRQDGSDLRIQQLEQGLAQTHEDMRSITEDQEAVNEELQSANEELLSSSEELQSLNEELETSKEELQSTNEELMIVNQEMIALNEQITEARDYAEAIVGTIHEPIIILDKQLRVKSANRSFYDTFRVKEEQTEGVHLYDLGDKQWNIAGLRELLEDIIPKNTAFYDFEVTHTFKDIGKKIMMLNARQIVQKTHSTQLILLAIHDITELRVKTLELQAKERELLQKDISDRQANKEMLEKVVEDRTKELKDLNKELAIQNEEKEKRAAELTIANKELAFQSSEKEKRAAELLVVNRELASQNEQQEKQGSALIVANKELESFAYIASHDLQEPLRKIQTFSKIILEKESVMLSENGKDYFYRMQRAAKRMQTLIDDLLAFSRLSTVNRTFHRTELSDIIEDVTSDFKDMIAEKAATIECNQLGTANIIPFQFRQLMQNLIGNALKFARSTVPSHIIIKSEISKGITLTKENDAVPTSALLPEKYYSHITISDNGIGFESRFKDRIFELFQRLHGKDEYIGTGIGLAIVKKIVENHNGIITARSEINQGAMFDIYIPEPESTIPT